LHLGALLCYHLSGYPNVRREARPQIGLFPFSASVYHPRHPKSDFSWYALTTGSLSEQPDEREPDMKLWTPRYDWPALLTQLASIPEADLLKSYPSSFEAALKSAERGKLIEPGAVELADELVKTNSTAALRDLLQDEFANAQRNTPAPKLSVPKTAPAAQASTPSAGISSSTGSRLQWAIIWVSVLTAAHVWLGLDLSDLWPNPGYRWGLGGYLYPAYTDHRPELAFVILVVGALLLWQTSGRWPAGVRTPAGSLRAMFRSTKALVVACLIILLFLLALHFNSAAQAQRRRGSGSFGRFGSSSSFTKWAP